MWPGLPNQSLDTLVTKQRLRSKFTWMETKSNYVTAVKSTLYMCAVLSHEGLR